MSVIVRQFDFFDFEALRDAVVQDNRSEVVQIGHGSMSGTMTHLTVGTFGISTGLFSRGVRWRGVVSQHRWMFGMALASNGEVSAINHVLKAGDLGILAPSQERYASYQGAGQFALVFVEPQELQTFLGMYPGAPDLALLDQSSTMIVDPETASANVRQLSPLLDLLTEEGPEMSEDVAAFYRRNILELLTAAMRDASHNQDSQPQAAVRIVREVDRYLTDAGARPIHISELCEHFKVPRRTLYHAFDDVLGIAPITFLRQKRLGDVHTALLRGEPGLIRDIAIAHGFLEQGKFAREYRRLFGERPNETLHRAQRSKNFLAYLS